MLQKTMSLESKQLAYSKKVTDRFYEVLNSPKQFSVGRFDPKDPTVATGMTGAPACGDVMKLDLKIDPDTMLYRMSDLRLMDAVVLSHLLHYL